MTDETDTGAADRSKTLVGISFDDIYRAREFMSAANRLDSRNELVLEDLVLIVKADNGETNVVETKDLQGGRTAISGALWAGLVGIILGGPVGWVAGVAAGAGAGAAAAKLIDIGISDEWVAWFREAVVPGSATVALLAEELNEEALVVEARRFTGSHLVYTNLDDGAIDRLAAALGDSVGPDARTEPARED